MFSKHTKGTVVSIIMLCCWCLFAMLLISDHVIYNLNSKIRFNSREPKSKIDNQIKRKTMLRNYCAHYLNETTSKQRYANSMDYQKNYIYSDKVKALYCFVPKAACTSWKKMFQLFDGNFKSIDDVSDKDEIHQLPYHYLYNANVRKRLQIQNNYYSFMFTRHPLDRLLAAYRNKLVQPFNNTFYKTFYTPYILNRFNRKLHFSKYKNTTVTFLEFVKHVLTEAGYKDHHWAPMHQVCQLCSYKFDYLGKHETLYEDADNILKELDLSYKYEFPKLKYDYKKKTTGLLKKYYKQIPRYIMKDLYEYYKIDFQVFGYDIKPYMT